MNDETPIGGDCEHGYYVGTGCPICEALNAAPANPSADEEVETPSSLNIFEAIERLFSLAGISQEPGWDLYDSNIRRKLDEVRERMQELYTAGRLQSELATAQRKIERLIEELDWQNKRNSGHPTRGGFEFYINEEWMGLASAAMDGDYGWHATLAKRRFDPDDERVRVRRVAEDDELLRQLQTAMEERNAANAKLKKIEDGIQADAKDLATPRDGTKLTRAGLVGMIVFLKEDLAEAHSRLEEAEKGITHHRNALMTVRDRQSGSIGIEDLNMGIKHLNALLSRLSTSRETENKKHE